jgi:putative sigma-54 modulation protein
MQTTVTFKNLNPSKHYKAYVCDKLDRFDKLLDNPAEANIVLSVEKLRHIAEINLTGDRLNINAKEQNTDMHAAIDLVLDKLKKQLKKNKQKIRSRRSGSKDSDKNKTIPGESTINPDESEKQITVHNIDYKPMDIEEAVMQMDLISDYFLVFTNSLTNRVNVLYRRSDGDYGLIQPNT